MKPYLKTQTRVTIRRTITHIREAEFLEACAEGTDNKVIPLYASGVIDYQPPQIPLCELLVLHAQATDRDSPDTGPYLFVGLKNQQVLFPASPLNHMEQSFMTTVRELSFNDDLTERAMLNGNAVIAYGAVQFQVPAENPKLGMCLIVDCYYLAGGF